MRLELAGTDVEVTPQWLALETGDYDITVWRDQGFTNYDVICIGGGGGRGGGIDTANTGTLIRNYGGEGGGGGYHRVQGLLSLLPDTVSVQVGAAGTPGVEHVSSLAALTNGGDGGQSTFNGVLCCASGGKGGKKILTLSTTAASPGAHGGDGGIGDTTGAGGGAAGGICGDPDGSPASVDGEDGPINDDIGRGGGGGAGGISKYGDPVAYLLATAGGHGSWLPDDTLVAGNAEDPQTSGAGVDGTKPGRGGGAKATPLNNLPYVYGTAGADGAVIIYLS